MQAIRASKSVEKATYTPHINPNDAKSLISPAPIPPFESLFAIIRSNPERKKPISELKKDATTVFVNINSYIRIKILDIINTNGKKFGIILSL